MFLLILLNDISADSPFIMLVYEFEIEVHQGDITAIWTYDMYPNRSSLKPLLLHDTQMACFKHI